MFEAGNIHFLSAFIAFAIALALVPITIRFTLARGWLDEPGGRKLHERPVPRLGGIALFLATWAGYSFYLFFRSGWPELPQLGTALGLFGPGSLVFFLGVYDDLYGANAVKKLVFQLLAAVWAVHLGFNVKMIFNPFTETVVSTGPILSWLISVAWIMFVTNAVNLIDGMDGLAGGVSIIVATTIFFISFHLGLENVAFLSLSVAGACLGFLIYNFAPARIFMGDSGALFLGFLLACLSLEANVKRSAAIVIVGPPLVLALPILDSLTSMSRRFFLRREELMRKYGHDADSALKGWEIFKIRLSEVFKADREHIHHALLAVGLSSRSAVLILYAITAILGITAYRSTVYDAILSSTLVFVLLSLALFWLRRYLRRIKLREDA